MKDPRKIVYDSIAHRVNVSFEGYCEATKCYEFRTYHINGNLVCVVMVWGAEVHIVSSPDHKGRGLYRTIFKSVLEEIKDRYGYVITYVTDGHQEGEKLAKWLGFHKTNTKNGISEYEMR